MLDPRLNHLVAVARTGSFTAAARSVGVTQSAVTKSVADLERHLGYSLFHRTSRGALLTPAGRDFAERAARLLVDAQELLNGRGVKSDPYAGVLRIGICPASLEWRLIDPLARLLARHPGVRYEISGGSFERTVQLLRDGAVDVAVGFDAAFAEWPDLRRSHVPSLKTVLFVRRDHPILLAMPATVEDLAKYDFVSPSDSRPYGAIIRGFFENQNVDWRERVHIIDYFPIVRRIVATTNAIGAVTISHTQTETFKQTFAALDLNVFPISPLCCAVRARWDPKPAIRAFISLLAQDENDVA